MFTVAGRPTVAASTVSARRACQRCTSSARPVGASVPQLDRRMRRCPAATVTRGSPGLLPSTPPRAGSSRESGAAFQDAAEFPVIATWAPPAAIHVPGSTAARLPVPASDTARAGLCMPSTCDITNNGPPSDSSGVNGDPLLSSVASAMSSAVRQGHSRPSIPSPLPSVASARTFHADNRSGGAERTWGCTPLSESPSPWCSAAAKPPSHDRRPCKRTLARAVGSEQANVYVAAGAIRAREPHRRRLLRAQTGERRERWTRRSWPRTNSRAGD